MRISVTAYTKRAQISRIVPEQDRLSVGMDRMLIDINLHDILLNDKNVELHDGDIIQIFQIHEKYNNYVSINGVSVVRPGSYQFLPEMTVLDLIKSADGLLNDVFTKEAHIKRVNADLRTELISIDLNSAMEGEINHNIKLKALDELVIFNENQLKNMFSNVTITGPVKNPGQYSYNEGNSLNDIILLAGGFEEKVNSVQITVARSSDNSFLPEIFRFPKSNQEYITINEINSNNNINNFLLLPYDIVIVYSNPKNNPVESVAISGAVYRPGSYPIISKEEKVSDIITRSGGIKPEGYAEASSFIRANETIKLSFDKILKNSSSKENFSVFGGDQIFIGKKTNTVEVRGEVNQPGVFKYYSGYSLKKYLDIAGGLNVNAEKKEIWVSYPNGRSDQLKPFSFSPKIIDGSVINVGRKKEQEPFDITDYVTDLSSIIANIAQVLLLLNALK